MEYRDDLDLALVRYQEKFGDVPTTFGIADKARLVGVINQAIEAGRPLTDSELRDQMNLDPLPEGAVV